MKNLKFLIFFLVCLNTQLFSQEPVSFRNIALGGVIFDNLDLIYDPIELRFVDSLRIYTNLSNLTSTREQVFNNFSDNELLIGISRQNPFIKNLWNSLLVRWQDFEYANPVLISPDLTVGYLYGEGVLEYDFTMYADINGNGLYDVRRNIYQRKSNLRHDKNFSVVLNNSFLLEEVTIGLKIGFRREDTEYHTAWLPMGTGSHNPSGINYLDPEYEISYNEFHLDSNYTLLKFSEKGVFNNKFRNPVIDLAASVMVPFSKLELRGDLFFSTLNEDWDVTNSYFAQDEEFNHGIPGFKTLYTENQEFTMNEKTEGFNFGAGISLKYVFDKQLSRIYDGYWFIGAAYRGQKFDYTNNSNNIFNSYEDVFDGPANPALDILQINGENYLSSDEGDGTGSNILLAGRLNVPLMDDVFFGCGVSYSMYWMNRDTKFSSSYRNIRDYTLVDTLTNINDYVRTISQSGNADRTYEYEQSVITIPVGIEYLFTENRRWALRFGSVFRYVSTEERQAEQITDSKPYTIVTEYGNGNVTVEYDNNVYRSNSYKRPTAVSSTLFTYGLGFKATDNLQMDLLGFFDVENHVTLLEFVKFLRISFSLKI